jgi:hypothetical protein
MFLKYFFNCKGPIKILKVWRKCGVIEHDNIVRRIGIWD